MLLICASITSFTFTTPLYFPIGKYDNYKQQSNFYARTVKQAI